MSAKSQVHNLADLANALSTDRLACCVSLFSHLRVGKAASHTEQNLCVAGASVRSLGSERVLIVHVLMVSQDYDTGLVDGLLYGNV